MGCRHFKIFHAAGALAACKGSRDRNMVIGAQAWQPEIIGYMHGGEANRFNRVIFHLPRCYYSHSESAQ